MMRALVGAALLAAAGCASPPHSAQAFSFGILGDVPYSEAEERAFLAMMQRLDAEPLEFLVHVGDFKAGSNSPCSDALFDRRRAQFDASAHPFIYTPGDNDWTDCRRRSNGGWDPEERLARLQRVFFPAGESLGRTRIATEAQEACLAPPVDGCGCGAHPENRLWERAGVVFATLNVPGGNDNTGVDAAGDREARCRGEANRRWLERAVERAARAQARGLVVAIQANPWDTRKPVYRPLIASIEAAAQRTAKPLLFVHGDTHTFRVDMPFTATNARRLETYGSPFVGWVKVDVDPADPRLFRIDSRLHALVPPGF
jgi:hypothetical protein